MPYKLVQLFDEANAALFNLHTEMHQSMTGLPGAENWREVYAMRVKLNSWVRKLCENNFKPDVPRTA